MTKLTDTQSILLASAAKRDSGSLMPLPALKAPPPAVAKSLASLITRGLAEEREVSDANQLHRTDGDLSFGLFITAAGLAAIGVATAEPLPGPTADPVPKPEHRTKAALVLTFLQRTTGATLAELAESTGWLPHTTRAALTGIRKKGITLEKSKRDEVTCYRAVTA